MHNTPTSLSFSLVVFLAPPQGRLRVAEQQSDRAVSLFSLSLQVNKSPSESRATYTPTLLQSLNDTKETSQRVCVVFFFFFSFPILHSFFLPLLFAHALWLWVGGWLCTSAKVDGKQAHDKSLTFVCALSFCCRDNVEGQKGGEMSQQKKAVVHWGANKARLWFVRLHLAPLCFHLICAPQTYKCTFMNSSRPPTSLWVGLCFVYHGRGALPVVSQAGVCFGFVRLRGSGVLLQRYTHWHWHSHTHPGTSRWDHGQNAQPDTGPKSSATHQLTYSVMHTPHT